MQRNAIRTGYSDAPSGAKTGKGSQAGKGKGQKGIWRPSQEIVSKHVGTWRYLSTEEGVFKIAQGSRGDLQFAQELSDSVCVSGSLLPQEKRWLQADLRLGDSGQEWGKVRVRFCDQPHCMLYTCHRPGNDDFGPVVSAYLALTPPQASLVKTENLVAFFERASKFLQLGLAGIDACSFSLAKRDLQCVIHDLEAQRSQWEDEPALANIVAAGKSWTVQRIRSVRALALSALAECNLKVDPPALDEALELCDKALQDDHFCAEASLQKGFVLVRLKRAAEAAAAFRNGLASGDARSMALANVELDKLAWVLEEEELLKKVQQLREQGNRHVQEGQYRDASWRYEDCLHALWGKDQLYPSDVKERAAREGGGLWPQLHAAETAVLTNLSLCCLQGQLPDWPPDLQRATQLCELALAYDPEHVKAMVRLARAHSEQAKHEEAEAVLTKAARLRPKDLTIRKELERARCHADSSRKKAREWERQAFQNMFERLPAGFATPESVPSSVAWPVKTLPAPLVKLGPEEIKAFTANIVETLEQEGDAAYFMELLHTIRYAVELEYGKGAGKQLSRIVPLVQSMTRGGSIRRTHELGKGQRCLACTLAGLGPDQPLHATSGCPEACKYEWCKALASQIPLLLKELETLECQNEITWQVPWQNSENALPNTSIPEWRSAFLVQNGTWVPSGHYFSKANEVMAAVADFRPYEVAYTRVPPGCFLQHEANANFVLTLHLLLKLHDEGTYILRAGEHCAKLHEGGFQIFDPTYQHSVENKSNEDMILLVCHFYHPDVGEVERYALLLLAMLIDGLQSTGLVNKSTLVPAPSVDVNRALKYAA